MVWKQLTTEDTQPRGEKRALFGPRSAKSWSRTQPACACTCEEAHLLRVRSGDTSIHALRQNVSAGRLAKMSKRRAWLPPVVASLLISQQHLVVTESTEENERLPKERTLLEFSRRLDDGHSSSTSTRLSVRPRHGCLISLWIDDRPNPPVPELKPPPRQSLRDF